MSKSHAHESNGPHSHDHHHEAIAPDTPSRCVVVDIGGNVGALILRSDETHSGVEVEIHPVANPGSRTHVWVLPRESGNEITYAAVFPALEEGEYVVLDHSGVPCQTAHVVGGEVTTSWWACTPSVAPIWR